MPTYVITPTVASVPAVRIAAEDLFDLGHKVAAHLARHRQIRRGIPFDALVDNDRGVIQQQGLRKPVTFTIRKDI